VATINTKVNSRLWTNTLAIRHRGKKGKGKEEEGKKDSEINHSLFSAAGDNDPKKFKTKIFFQFQVLLGQN
jgi:hypothetical protein